MRCRERLRDRFGPLGSSLRAFGTAAGAGADIGVGTAADVGNPGTGRNPILELGAFIIFPKLHASHALRLSSTSDSSFALRTRLSMTDGMRSWRTAKLTLCSSYKASRQALL